MRVLRALYQCTVRVIKNCSFIYLSLSLSLLDIIDDYLDSNTWVLINYSVVVKEDMYSGEKWSQLHNRYRLMRNPTYHIFYMIIPTAFLSVLGVFAFLIPTGEDQLNLSITTLLSVTVFMLVVADSMPRSSTSIPILSMDQTRNQNMVAFF